MKYIYYFALPLSVYLIFTVFPEYYGCLLPKNICLESINKSSDFLTVSISLIPIFVIIGAYQVWRKQKTAELLAVDARSLYGSLKELKESGKLLMKSILENPSTTTTNHVSYINFETLYKNLNDQMDLFNLLLNEEDSKYKRRFSDFYYFYKSYGGTLKKINMYRIWSGDNVENRNYIHAQQIIEGIELKKFLAEIAFASKLLAKIILHKY